MIIRLYCSELKTSLRRLTPLLTVTQELTAVIQASEVESREVYIYKKGNFRRG
jgi:hypothetical protein